MSPTMRARAARPARRLNSGSTKNVAWSPCSLSRSSWKGTPKSPERVWPSKYAEIAGSRSRGAPGVVKAAGVAGQTSLSTVRKTWTTRTASGLAGEAPDAAHRRLVGERELRQREVVREVVEHGLHALADGHVGLRLGPELRGHEVADDAQRLVGGGLAALLVQLDEPDRGGRPVLEAGLDRVVHHLVGVDVAPARPLLPGPLP